MRMVLEVLLGIIAWFVALLLMNFCRRLFRF